MEIVRCSNGHFYDSDRFEECPYCNNQRGVIEEPDEGKTVPLNSENDIPEDNESEDEGKTIGYFDWTEKEEHTVPAVPKGGPVVGWLVAMNGKEMGTSFTLKSGKNFIGRSQAMDIPLRDASVSREKHAIVVYEPKGNIFLVTPGEAKELFYLNGQVVLEAKQLNAYDRLEVGQSELCFVPFCNEQFRWKTKGEAE